jgi:hypothetical protein
MHNLSLGKVYCLIAYVIAFVYYSIASSILFWERYWLPAVLYSSQMFSGFYIMIIKLILLNLVIYNYKQLEISRIWNLNLKKIKDYIFYLFLHKYINIYTSNNYLIKILKILLISRTINSPPMCVDFCKESI